MDLNNKQEMGLKKRKQKHAVNQVTHSLPDYSINIHRPTCNLKQSFLNKLAMH